MAYAQQIAPMGLALLSGGMGLMEAGGWQPRPVSTGQAMGQGFRQGLGGYQTGMQLNEMQRRQTALARLPELMQAAGNDPSAMIRGLLSSGDPELIREGVRMRGLLAQNETHLQAARIAAGGRNPIEQMMLQQQQEAKARQMQLDRWGLELKSTQDPARKQQLRQWIDQAKEFPTAPLSLLQQAPMLGASPGSVSASLPPGLSPVPPPLLSGRSLRESPFFKSPQMFARTDVGEMKLELGKRLRIAGKEYNVNQYRGDGVWYLVPVGGGAPQLYRADRVEPGK